MPGPLLAVGRRWLVLDDETTNAGIKAEGHDLRDQVYRIRRGSRNRQTRSAKTLSRSDSLLDEDALILTTG